jgi:hypothetical protein
VIASSAEISAATLLLYATRGGRQMDSMDVTRAVCRRTPPLRATEGNAGPKRTCLGSFSLWASSMIRERTARLQACSVPPLGRPRGGGFRSGSFLPRLRSPQDGVYRFKPPVWYCTIGLTVTGDRATQKCDPSAAAAAYGVGLALAVLHILAPLENRGVADVQEPGALPPDPRDLSPWASSMVERPEGLARTTGSSGSPKRALPVSCCWPKRRIYLTRPPWACPACQRCVEQPGRRRC